MFLPPTDCTWGSWLPPPPFAAQDGFPGGTSGKEPACMEETQKTRVWFLGQEDPLEKEMAIHSSILARKIPWTEEPGRLQPKGLKIVEQFGNLITTRHFM